MSVSESSKPTETEDPIVAEYKKGYIVMRPQYAVPRPPNWNSPEAKAARAENPEDKGKKRGKKRKRGQNKNRKDYRVKAVLNEDGKQLCFDFARDGKCSHSECRFHHDVKSYFAVKPPDVSKNCVHYDLFGQCEYGALCRCAEAHTDPVTFEQQSKQGSAAPDYQSALNAPDENYFRDVRRGLIPTPIADTVTNALDEWRDRHKEGSHEARAIRSGALDEKNTYAATTTPAERATWSETDILYRPIHKERNIDDWEGLTYVAPLTTVGNLPFRRIVKECGADITCGEMAVVSELLKGSKSEWALLKRHPSEDRFGVQICGKQIGNIAKACEMINEKCEVDFVDLNVGCPIDLVCYRGMGSQLMQRRARLWDLGRAMSVVSSTPVTIKMRKGWNEDQINAHDLIPYLERADIAAVTVHGRTRQQRYSKFADWNYIANQCYNSRHSTPVIGNGDVYTFRDFERHRAAGVKTVMIARGGLIKPWLFTEIKEKKDWDISSSERFEYLRKFANYGLEHWGSDARGVETTRRFMLEWISFLHRYVPVGVQERPDMVHMNLKNPRFIGRDDMETLMGSSNGNDWVKLSSMLLGPPPADYTFVPKHKANAGNEYEG